MSQCGNIVIEKQIQLLFNYDIITFPHDDICRHSKHFLKKRAKFAFA